MDLFTLFFSNIIICASLALGMKIWSHYYKVFPGYKEWTLAYFFQALGHVALVLRGGYISLLTSVLLCNGLYMVTSILRMEGISLFLRERKISRKFWIAPVIILILLGWFTANNNSMLTRGIILSIWFSFVASFVALYCFRYSDKNSFPLLGMLGFLCLAFAVMYILRTTVWLVYPNKTLFEFQTFHSIYITSIMTIELLTGIVLILTHAQRLENDLRESETRLGQTIGELETAMDELQILEGLLPMCASCKKVKDESGSWLKIEEYLENNSEMQVSHGICAECVKKHYPNSTII